MAKKRWMAVLAAGSLSYLALRRPPGRILASGEYDFNPGELAYHERAAWQVYYQRRWVELFYHLLKLAQGTAGFSLAEALLACYYSTLAQIAFAPADNDVPKAEQAMARYYEMMRRAMGGVYDPAEAARLELVWWTVHRQVFNQGKPEPIAEAFRALYAYLHGSDSELLHEAAEARAEATIYSDGWVAGPRQPDDRIWDDVEAALLRSYRALHRAIKHPA